MQDTDRSTVPGNAEIVQRVRRGDVQAYGMLVARYERSALAAVLGILPDLHAAQDVVQEAFVRCYVKLHSLRDASRFGYWLMKVARREAIRTSRKRKRVETIATPAAEEAPMHLPPLDDEKQWLLSRIRQLPEHERMVITLRFFDGHGVKEIAQITHRPVGTVTKQLSRALERLRRELESEMRP